MTEPIFTDLTDIAKKTPFSKEQWDTIVRRLVEENDPLRIYLHGSYVWGKPDENSDIDLCLLLPFLPDGESEGDHCFADIDEWDIDVDIAVDVYSPSKGYFEKMLSSPATLEYRMFHEGIVLYTKPNLVFDHSRPMYRLDEEYIEKAEENLRMSRKAIEDVKPMLGSCLFHIQQVYEMSLRAFWAFHLRKIIKDHSIRLLRKVCGLIDPDFLSIENFTEKDSRRITKYHVARYKPVEQLPSLEEIQDQIELAEKMLRFVEHKMATTPRPTEPAFIKDDESESERDA